LASTKPQEAVTEAKRSECAPSRRTVRFEYEDVRAHEVFLAGSFNDWDSAATQMGLGPTGVWGVELSLSLGRYEYLFVVDGRWTPDPKATDYLPNPFGGCNSVCRVE
jgi:1,4-alpha-glucan branching enzyme